MTTFNNKGIIMRHLTFIIGCAILFHIPNGHSKIVNQNGEFFVVNNQERIPIFIVNQLIEKGELSRIKLYGAGSAHLISFKKNNDKEEKLYSVDEKGFIYSISPFTDYSVTDVDELGNFKFRETQNKKFFINPKGFFLN